MTKEDKDLLDALSQRFIWDKENRWEIIFAIYELTRKYINGRTSI